MNVNSKVLPDINGTLRIRRRDDGAYEIVNIDRDDYSTLEVYYYEDGVYQYWLYRDWESPYGPFIALNPLWPNDTEDD